VLQRGQVQEQEAERRRDEQNTQSVIDALAQTEDTLKELGDRLAGIESKLSA